MKYIIKIIARIQNMICSINKYKFIIMDESFNFYVKKLISQVFSKKPINAPTTGRCY
jgi:hypothetical protein